MHELTLFLSWCGIILKLFIIVLVGISESDIIKSSLVATLKQKGNNDFIPYNDEDQY